MAGGKFDNTATLAANNWVQWPQGPLFHKIGETVIRVEVWLMQKTTGAIQMTYTTQNLNLGSWRADTIWWPRVSANSANWDGYGRFARGPAMGTAVAIARNGNNQSYFWWSEEVEII
jgi:hypothetical protein